MILWSFDVLDVERRVSVIDDPNVVLRCLILICAEEHGWIRNKLYRRLDHSFEQNQHLGSFWIVCVYDERRLQRPSGLAGIPFHPKSSIAPRWNDWLEAHGNARETGFDS